MNRIHSVVPLNPLDLKQPDVGVVPDRRIHVSQVDDSPHVCAEPHGGACVGLVLPDEDGMRNRQEADQRTVLQEVQDF